MTADAEQEKCAKCEKTVYEAEGLPAGTNSILHYEFDLLRTKNSLPTISKLMFYNDFIS